MRLFGRKEIIFLNSEQQKEEFINKLENAHVKYKLKKDEDVVSGARQTYTVKVYADDLKRVV